MLINAYHKDLNSLHIGCEKPRAYFIPFHSEEAALKGVREKSERFISLCGEWDFEFYGSFEDIGEVFLSSALADKIAVPACWQTRLGKGYDAPL